MDYQARDAKFLLGDTNKSCLGNQTANALFYIHGFKLNLTNFSIRLNRAKC